jgi:hypothetical protein
MWFYLKTQDDWMELKIIISLLLITLFFSLVSSQIPSINVEHTGYGKTARDVYLSIQNTGSARLSNISIIVDGNTYKTIDGALGVNKRIGTMIYLEPGNHIIAVTSQEGAYDSIELVVSSQEEKEIETSKTFVEKNKTIISVVIVIIIFSLVAWIVIQKPKF